jgi:hypothetical protein
MEDNEIPMHLGRLPLMLTCPPGSAFLDLLEDSFAGNNNSITTITHLLIFHSGILILTMAIALYIGPMFNGDDYLGWTRMMSESRPLQGTTSPWATLLRCWMKQKDHEVLLMASTFATQEANVVCGTWNLVPYHT